MWNRILNSNLVISIIIGAILAVSIGAAVVQKCIKDSYYKKLDTMYNVLQDKFDLLMKNENISSFKDSKWNKINTAVRNNKITPAKAQEQYEKVISTAFEIPEENITAFGQYIFIDLRKDHVSAKYYNGPNDGEYGVLFVDVNGMAKPNLPNIDKFVLRIDEDGSLSIADQIISTIDSEEFKYIKVKRTENANK